jgi:thioredoxin-related protein
MISKRFATLLVIAVIVVSIAVFSFNQTFKPIEVGGEIVWLNDINEALTLAERDSKPLLIYFHSSGCTGCKALEADVFGDEEIASFLDENFVNVKIDVNEKPELAAECMVWVLPTTFFANSDGIVVRNIEGYRTPADFYDAAKNVLDELET